MSSKPLHSAYILHRTPWRDTSLLIEAFSAEHGRIGLVARGVRGKRSSRAALLQPFQALLLSWAGRGDLLSLHNVEPDGPTQGLHGAALISGFYLNELLMRLLQRHDPHPELYHAYRTTLLRLQDPEQIEWTLRLFECDLLDHLGYGLLLDCAADTGLSLDPQRAYVYLPERGPVPAEQAEGQAISGETLLALAQAQWPLLAASDTVLREAKHLMRQSLARYLGPKPLASRALFQTTGSK
jgi:DNA repair protein RecO (recombination protein O)